MENGFDRRQPVEITPTRMPPAYEIIVFENHELYDSSYATMPEEAIMEFVKMCKKYVNPLYVSEEETRLTWSSKSIMYLDRGGSDKAMMVQLIGDIPGELYMVLHAEMKKLYRSNCEECSVEIPLKYGLCEECANK